jgi:DnaJ-domain-containing protein 1
MDSFDHIREIQRLLDSLRPAVEQYELIQRQLQEAAVSLPVKDVLREFERSQVSLMIAADFAAQQRALIAAVQPLTIQLDKIVTSMDSAMNFTAMSDFIARVNVGIDTARYLGQIELASETQSEQSRDEGIVREVESKLVEIIPADALGDLRKVEFAPVVLLDRVLRDPEAMRRLGAREFEGFVATLVEQLGFDDVILTPRSGDEGRDILATKRIHGISILCAFECKKWAPNRLIGPEVARALLGTITHSSTRVAKGVLVTTSHFTPSARRFILTEPTLDGKDFDGIVDWLREYGSKAKRVT